MSKANGIEGLALQQDRFQRLLPPGSMLSQRIVRGGFWVFVLRIVERLFGLARTVVLARLLAPKDFGLFGIALLAISALETFSQTGFQQALIQKNKDIKAYLDTAWTVQAIRGVVLAFILFGIGPYVAEFFDEPMAAALVRLLGLSMLFQGLSNIGVVYFQKELEFRKQFIYQLSGTLVDLVVAIAAALLLRNAWALIFGLLAGNLVRMIASYLIHPYRPRVRLEGAKAKELYSFGRWVLGSSILIFLLAHGDDILVGKVLGTAALGFYQMAYLISNLPATEITHVISQVTFPAYSKLQDNLPKLREAYLITLQLTAFASIPLAGGIFILSPEFTRIFLGAKWIPMVPAMQLLCILGAIRSIVAASGPIFLALGRPDIDTKISASELALLAILIYPLTTRSGITGTAASVSVTSCSFISIILAIVIKLVKMERSEILNLMKYISFPLLAIIPLFPVKMFILKPLVENDILLFCIVIATGIFIYSIGIYILDRYSNYDMVVNLKYAFNNLRT